VAVCRGNWDRSLENAFEDLPKYLVTVVGCQVAAWYERVAEVVRKMFPTPLSLFTIPLGVLMELCPRLFSFLYPGLVDALCEAWSEELTPERCSDNSF
jgi:hypothetical protein